MYIPYSQRSPISETFTGGNLFTNITGALESVGWTKSISGIYTYMSCISPQGITSKVTMWTWDWHRMSLIGFKLGNTGQGATYALWNTPRTYQLVANQCQFFISVPGLKYDWRGSVVCGGVPYVSTIGSLTECWWSCGDWVNDLGGFFGETWRKSLLLKTYDSGPQGIIARDAYYNGNYCAPHTPNLGLLRLETFTGAGEIIHAGVSTLANTVFYDESSIFIPALLTWGATGANEPKIRGIIWDAMVGTGPEEVDKIIMVDGNTWINFTHEQYFGSLYLLMPYSDVGGNYAYHGRI